MVDRPELRWEYVERGTKRARVENPVDVALLVDHLFEPLAVNFLTQGPNRKEPPV